MNKSKCRFKLVDVDQGHGQALLQLYQQKDQAYSKNIVKEKDNLAKWYSQQRQNMLNKQKEEHQIYRPLLLNSGYKINPQIPSHLIQPQAQGFNGPPNQLHIILPQNRKRHPNSPNISL
jgi:hypothetical protein